MVSYDFLGLSLDAFSVISARTALGLTGSLTASEATRMVAEKQVAAAQASLEFAKGALHGDLEAGSAASFDVYKKAVAANRKLLVRKSR